MKSFDICIIGAGWAGYTAALRADSLGMSVALIEDRDTGGTCLNQGCIPTKSYVNAAKIFSQCKKAGQFGIEHCQPAFNLAFARDKKNNLVKTLRSNLEALLKTKKNITYIRGHARLISSNEISIEHERIAAKNILIASGSEPRALPALAFDGAKIISSAEILELGTLPKSILIVGGGVIGCEFTSIFAEFGVSVTLVEALDRILPIEDPDISRKIETVFRKKGVTVLTGTDAAKLNCAAHEKILVCVGRSPRECPGTRDIGVAFEKDRIIVNDCMQTNIAGIFAAGDCTSLKQLAHVAAHQAIIAVENVADATIKKKFDYRLVPNCIFTDPEAASIGISEEDARRSGLMVVVDKFDFLASGMARVIGESEGFIKIVSNASSGVVLGASIIGPKATELIAIVSTAMQRDVTRKQLADMVFAHPTIAECIGDAARRGMYGF